MMFSSLRPLVVFSNVFAQLVAKGVAVLLTLLSTYYLLRLGGPSLFGDYTKVLVLIVLGFTAINFGLNAEAVRSMVGPLSSRRQVFFSTLLTRFWLALFVMVVLNLIALLLPGGYSGEIKRVFWIGSFAIVFQGFYTSANVWFQRHLEYWRSTLALVLGTTFGTALTLFYILTKPSLFHLLLAFTLGYAIMGICALALTRQFSFLPRHFSPSPLRRSLALGGILILSVLVAKLDVIFLGIFRPAAEVGEYGFAYRIFDVALVLPTFVMNSVYPLLVGAPLSRRNKLISLSLRYLVVSGFIALFVLYPLVPLISLIRPDMNLAIFSLRLLLLGLPVFYATSPLMWHLIVARRESSLLILYALAALFNGILNLVFIPRFGAVAAALLTGATELLILIGLLFIERRPTPPAVLAHSICV